MEQYVSKSALVAEIEKLVDKGKYHEEYDCAYRDGNNGALYALKNKLNTLEIKEVDLENKWIDCSERMPEEMKRNFDFLQVQQEWNESEKVLAYDSMYGARVDYTVNGKWHSELQRGVGGQILHGIIAWMPIQKYV